MPIERSVLVVDKVKHPRRFKASPTSSKHKQTLYKTDSYTATGLSTTTDTNPEIAKEVIPEPETLHGSEETSLEDNHDSLSEKKPSPTTSQTYTVDNDWEDVIDKIVGHKEISKQTLYQVRWCMYRTSNETCEPESNILAHFVTCN